MTLPLFLNASYALLVEEHQRIDPFKDFGAVAEKLLPSDGKREVVPRPAQVQAQNEQSMAMLQGMLGKTKGNPLEKKRTPRRVK